MNRDDRERFADLFDRLVSREVEVSSDDEHAALRLLSNAFLNYIDVSSDHGEAVTNALPWIAALHRWSQRDWDGGRVADFLRSTHAVTALGPNTLASRLSSPAETDLNLPRVPQASLVRDDHRAIIMELADIESQLRRLSSLESKARLEAVLTDVRLAASAVEVCANDPESDFSRTLDADVDGAMSEDAWPWSRRFAPEEPLWVLAGLADTDGRHPMAGSGFELTRRSRGFERGLATNMDERGLAPAVRAALVFGRGERTDTRELSDILRQTELFREDSALEALALALASVRGSFHDHMRGLIPLSGLEPWVDYLRDGCVELAESRDITLREATGYAHYALHLVNMCDLCAEGPDACNEATRDALMHVEDELKEFAMAGNRGDGPRQRASLAAFESSRWRQKGATAELAGRLTRLRGAWRSGLEPGPLGSPPTLDKDVTAHSRALLESHFDDEVLLAALARAMRHAHLRGFDWTARLTPDQLLTCLVLSIVQARDLPGVDITQPFEMDFGPVMRWLSANDGSARGEILTRMLEHLTVDHVVQRCQEPSLLRVGLVGRVDAGATGRPGVAFEFVATREMKAILELLSSTADDDGFADTLRDRLDAMLEDGLVPGSDIETDASEVRDEDLVGTVLPSPGAAL